MDQPVKPPSKCWTLSHSNYIGLRLVIGAYRTSPIESLYTESNEPTLELLREKLTLQYTLKIATHPDNLTDNSVFDPKKPPI